MANVSDYEAVEGEATGRGIRSARDPRHWAGAEPQNILANAEATFVFNLNMDMNPEQLVIPDVFAPSVAVVSATIGPINIQAGDGPFPGDAFKAESTVRFLPAVPITNGQPLRVRVRNTTTGTLTGFYCGIIGKVKRSA